MIEGGRKGDWLGAPEGTAGMPSFAGDCRSDSHVDMLDCVEDKQTQFAVKNIEAGAVVEGAARLKCPVTPQGQAIGAWSAVTVACAPHAAIVDGFPPYAWQTCAGWMNGYEANNKTIQGASGVLSIGKLLYEELHGNDAYVIYASTFSNTQKGKPVVYKGTMTMTLRKTGHGWVFTGPPPHGASTVCSASASCWTGPTVGSVAKCQRTCQA